jgi:hypothetical protein
MSIRELMKGAIKISSKESIELKNKFTNCSTAFRR